uniref:Putative nadh dehydrogenase ubiquinone 1 beta subcomplex subunit 2 mitochondrial n=1 Tax=Nyssomyia neivai TaxID=330878 RepID=A0A1L8E138_9DIPT
MISSRSAILGRCVAATLLRSTRGATQKQSVRSGHAWSYRTAGAPHPKAVVIGSHTIGAIMWWWILWHLWHEPEHLTGEFPYPDPSKWTNAELGIPPDADE